MPEFKTTILKFGNQGEKTGWTYIVIPGAITEKIWPGRKQGFQVKGQIDQVVFKGMNLLPMGEGDFILALNATIRKAIGKGKGATVQVSLDLDEAPYQLNQDFVECLQDEPRAKQAFGKMPFSHQKYYSKWIESGKTEETRAKRIAMAVNALADGLDYGAMLRRARDEKKMLGH